MAMVMPPMGMNGAPPMMPGAQYDPLRERKQQIRTVYAPMIRSLRDRRRPIEDREWLPNVDCWKARHRRQGFRGEWFNHYVPAGRRSMERYVTRCKQQLFPSPDGFEVYPANEGDPLLAHQAEAIKNYLQWRLWRCRFRSLATQILRSLCLYQRGIAATYLDMRDVPGQVWPSVRAVDPFSFYIWPETATNIDNAQVLVEHTMMPFEEYDLLASIGACDPLDPSQLAKPEWPQYLIERLSRAGLTPPSDVATGGPPEQEPIALVAMTELWVRRGAGWEQSWLVWNVKDAPVIVRLTDQPYAPYRMAVARQIPGEHYTTAMMSDLEPLNVVLNDILNMTLESQATAIFPPTLIDPAAVNSGRQADSFVFGPRRKWLVDPQSVEFGQFPNTAGVGYQGMQAMMGLMDSFSGSSPLAEGTPTRGMPRAGFAVSSLIGLSMSDIRDTAELVEDEILTPLLGDLHRITLTQIPREQLVSIPGAEGVTAWRGSVAQLMMAASFRWVGTLQAQDMQVRAQRMLTLVGQFAKLYQPMLQQGFGINFPLLGKRLWRDALGERGAESIIVALTDLQRQIAMMGGGPPGPNVNMGGMQAPAPASPEQSERQMSRNMTESSAGQTLAGTGVG